MKIVVIRPSAGSPDCAFEVRFIECDDQCSLGSRCADQCVLPQRERWPGEDPPVEGHKLLGSRGCSSVARIPLGHGPETLLRHLLVGNRARSCDLRIPAGACAAVVCRLRSQRESNCCPTLSAKDGDQRASAKTHSGLLPDHRHRGRRGRRQTPTPIGGARTHLGTVDPGGGE